MVATWVPTGPLTVDYTDPVLAFLGRSEDVEVGRQFGWQGSQIRFKVSGTLNLKVTCDVVDPSVDNQGILNINIDRGNYVAEALTTLPEIITATFSHTFAIPDTGEHLIVLKPNMWPKEQWKFTTDRVVFRSMELDEGGTVTAWGKDGTINTMAIGDSWMGATNGWPELLPDKYNPWFVSMGGLKTNTMNDRIDFMYEGNAYLGQDPDMDIIILNSGVNDLAFNYTTLQFNTWMSAALTKIRVQHPDPIIFFIGCPDNTGAGELYSVYDGEMTSLAAADGNAHFISLASIQASLVWIDTYHIDYDSRVILANYVDGQITSILGS